MTALAKYVAQGLDLRQGTEITALTQTIEGWDLTANEALGTFDRVICTAPAPLQVAQVLACVPGLAPEPLQVSHGSQLGMRICASLPLAASSSVTSMA